MIHSMIKFAAWCFVFIALSIPTTQLRADKLPQPQKVKNIVLLIGDGMGPQQIGLLLNYARLAPNSIYKGGNTAIEDMINAGQTGLSLTHPASKIVVDSACSATQLATGHISGSEMIGLDHRGNSVQTVLEYAQQQGRKVGLVSDTRMTHATPAAFAAHQPHRSLENDIAVQMLAREIDVLLSGGLRHWIPKSVNTDTKAKMRYQKLTGGDIKIKSKRKDDKDLLTEAQQMGYTTVFDRNSLTDAKGKVLGLFSYSGMANGIVNTQHKNDPYRKEPTLAEMTTKALELLSNNEQGFFLMVEGGQIDWTGHNNDAGTMLHEMIKFDDTIRVVYEWAKSRKDTVVVLTADHETGGPGFSYSRFNIPKGQKLSATAFNNRLFKPNFNFCERGLLDKIYDQKKDFPGLLADFNALPKDRQSAPELARLIRDATGFPVTSVEAEKVLATEPNQYRVPGHKYLDAHTFPKVDDFESFYVYGEEIRNDLIGRTLAKHQCSVWATGTHTATPVTVTVLGPNNLKQQVKGINTHAEVGELMISWLGKLK